MATPTSTWSSSQMLVVLVMYMLWLLKGQELGGCQCQGTGVRTGRATTILMAKASPSRSPLVMATLWSLTMLPQLVGPLAKPTLVLNSARDYHKTTFFKFQATYLIAYNFIQFMQYVVCCNFPNSKYQYMMTQQYTRVLDSMLLGGVGVGVFWSVTGILGVRKCEGLILKWLFIILIIGGAFLFLKAF